MGYAENTILKVKELKEHLISFEGSLGRLELSERLRECQDLNEKNDELSIAKIFILYLDAEQEIKFEIKRIFDWNNVDIKTDFLVSQFESKNLDVVLTSIEMIGLLKESRAIPYLNEIFRLEDFAVSKKLVSTLGEIGDPLGIKTIKLALKTTDKDLLLLSIRTLARWTDEVPWKVFKPFLIHPYKEARIEAAFAIALRKNPKSAKHLLKSLDAETDDHTRYMLIQYAGMIPSNKILIPLLKISTHDPNQKARFVASRTLDRLQGILKPGDLYRLRNVKDISIRADVIFRLGKFGTDSDRYKNYIRIVLSKTKDQLLIQACLQALGYIAEHQDVELLTKFLDKDPMSAYNALMSLTKTWRPEDKDNINQILKDGLFSAYSAAIALTRTWRLEDKDKVLETLESKLSATQKQVVIKYLIRRRGFSIDPKHLLNTVKAILKEDKNINVRYLSLNLLEYAPCVETMEYLLHMYTTTKDQYEMEAISKALSKLASKHERFIISFIAKCDDDACHQVLHFVPDNLEPAFYNDLALALFDKFGDVAGKSEQICHEMCRIFLNRAIVTKQFMAGLPSASWQRMFLEKLLRHEEDLDLINSIKPELIKMLNVDDDEVKNLVIRLLLSLKNPEVLPHLMIIAESKRDSEPRTLAREAIKTFAREGAV